MSGFFITLLLLKNSARDTSNGAKWYSSASTANGYLVQFSLVHKQAFSHSLSSHCANNDVTRAVTLVTIKTVLTSPIVNVIRGGTERTLAWTSPSATRAARATAGGLTSSRRGALPPGLENPRGAGRRRERFTPGGYHEIQTEFISCCPSRSRIK